MASRMVSASGKSTGLMKYLSGQKSSAKCINPLSKSVNVSIVCFNTVQFGALCVAPVNLILNPPYSTVCRKRLPTKMSSLSSFLMGTRMLSQSLMSWDSLPHLIKVLLCSVTSADGQHTLAPVQTIPDLESMLGLATTRTGSKTPSVRAELCITGKGRSPRSFRKD